MFLRPSIVPRIMIIKIEESTTLLVFCRDCKTIISFLYETLFTDKFSGRAENFLEPSSRVPILSAILYQ